MEMQLLGLLAEYGILGIILVGVIWVMAQLWKDLKASWDARLLESKQLLLAIENTNSTYAELAKANENRAKASEAIAQAQLAATQAIVQSIDMLKSVDRKQAELVEKIEIANRRSEQIRSDVLELINRVSK